MNAPTLTRRGFNKGAGGIVLAFSLLPAEVLAQAAAARLPGSLNNNRLLDAWIRINADGTATVHTGKVELGQGILTALWQIAAEELDLPLSRVTITQVDTSRSPNEGFTFGSQSIENSGVALRLAGAEARAILIELAAKKLGADAAALKVADGVISAPDGKRVTYGELAAEANLKREASAKVRPKPASEHKIVGKSIPRLDIPAKVMGGAAYVQDLRLPGMLHGRVVRPPRYGAKLESVDEAAARRVPGVVAVVRDGSFLGVIAEREENAVKARAALIAGAKWSGGDTLPDPAKLYEHLRSRPAQTTVSSEKKATVLASAKVIEATYNKPYMSHASIGPSCAVAQFADGRYTVWSHGQGMFPLRVDLAKALKVPPPQIRCIHFEGSGCYGHNGADDAALDAALLARAAPGRPVRVQWMRDDEFAWSPYGCAMSMKVKGALDGGKIVHWDYELWSNTHSMRPANPAGNNLLASWHVADAQKHGSVTNVPIQFGGGSDRNAVPLYDFPSQRVVNHLVGEMPLRASALRTLGAYSNVWASECFMDELALAAGADPVAFRLAHMTDPRAKAVIEKVAAMANWKPGEKGSLSRGRGIAFSKYKNLACYVAVIADVEIDRASGKVRVREAWAATDAGLVINPDGLKNQIEGGIVQTASWTLLEEVRFDRNGIRTRDWSGYPILAMPDVPKVSVELINRPNERPLGSGEGSQGPAGAAIGNAVAHATGKRLRDLPLDAARVKAALG
ncbi:MAG: xanthine dehydrogenase family protein molybdopterin-binding subunit [Alphaproteobacteria bacterium]|nr:xanthine dehydrogenase family protein molybdopterin-binding subunit [Alphaproteobacteria bacterium]